MSVIEYGKDKRKRLAGRLIRYSCAWLMVCIIIYAGSIGLAASVLSMRGSPPVVTYVTYVDGNPYLVNVFGGFAVAQVHVAKVANARGEIVAESPPVWHRLIKNHLVMPRLATGTAYTILVFPLFPLVRATVEVSWGDVVGSMQVKKLGGIEAEWVNSDRSTEFYVPTRPVLGNIAIVAGVALLCVRGMWHAKQRLVGAFRQKRRLCAECGYPVAVGGPVCPECGSRPVVPERTATIAKELQ